MNVSCEWVSEWDVIACVSFTATLTLISPQPILSITFLFIQRHSTTFLAVFITEKSSSTGTSGWREKERKNVVYKYTSVRYTLHCIKYVPRLSWIVLEGKRQRNRRSNPTLSLMIIFDVPFFRRWNSKKTLLHRYSIMICKRWKCSLCSIYSRCTLYAVVHTYINGTIPSKRGMYSGEERGGSFALSDLLTNKTWFFRPARKRRRFPLQPIYVCVCLRSMFHFRRSLSQICLNEYVSRRNFCLDDKSRSLRYGV